MTAAITQADVQFPIIPIMGLGVDSRLLLVLFAFFLLMGVGVAWILRKQRPRKPAPEAATDGGYLKRLTLLLLLPYVVTPIAWASKHAGECGGGPLGWILIALFIGVALIIIAPFTMLDDLVSGHSGDGVLYFGTVAACVALAFVRTIPTTQRWFGFVFLSAILIGSGASVWLYQHAHFVGQCEV